MFEVKSLVQNTEFLVIGDKLVQKAKDDFAIWITQLKLDETKELYEELDDSNTIRNNAIRK